MSKKNGQERLTNEDTNSKIEAIKNLIFGENIAEYDNEFQAIRDDILQKKAALEELISTVETELNESIDNLSTEVNIRITNLQDTIESKIDGLDKKKVDRKKIGDLLVKLGNKISE